MPFNQELAARVRVALAFLPQVEEKKMFRGLCFLVNEKMCVGVSGENLMCRFDPNRQEEITRRPGFTEMKMKGRLYAGYGYINPDHIKSEQELKFYLKLCLDFNPQAKSSKKK
jgi:TfoX/Sxy family transcriptional regulator of competence genes